MEGTITFGASCSRNILPLPELISLSHGEYYLSFLVTLKIFSFQTQLECLEIDTLGLHSSLGSSDPLEEAQEGKIRRNDSFHFHGTCTPQERACTKTAPCKKNSSVILNLRYLINVISWRNYVETIKPTYVLKMIVSSHYSLVLVLASFI